MAEAVRPLVDELGARRLAARWVVTADVVLETPASIGGDVAEPADLAVRRDRRSGLPVLTGASLAGALRSHLADRLLGYEAADADDDIARLFGAWRPHRNAEGAFVEHLAGGQSAVITYDALADLPGPATEIRDGVAIDPARGTAEDHKKFTVELLPAGTRFPVRVDLLVPEGMDEPRVLALLVAALEGLAPDGICLGARRSRGLGRLHATDWRACRYDLRFPQGWVAWVTAPTADLDAGHHAIDDGSEPHATVRGAVEAASPGLVLRAIGADPANRVVVTASLTLPRALLVRSPPGQANAPDDVHLKSGGRSVLPGTSLAGALRARALRIARLARPAPGRAEALVEGLFGPRPEPGSGLTLRASRLRVGEAVVDDGERVRSTRIRIDRATQGVAKGALLEEEPHVGGRLELRLELRNPRPGETGLLLLLLKDLLSGDLAVGGSAAVGRGVLKGSARLSLPGAGEDLVLEPGGEADPVVQREISEVWADGD